MAALIRGVSLFCPRFGQLVRHKSKPNIGKTRVPFPLRHKVLETTAKPLFEKQSPICDNILKKKIKIEDKPLTTYERLLGEELIENLNKHSLVGIYHENVILKRNLFSATKLCLRNRMSLKMYNRQVTRGVLKGTRYECLLPLFHANTKMIFSMEPQLDIMLKMQKKMPEFILLGCIFENRVLSKPDMEWYTSLPELDQMRAQLCHTLNSPAMQTLNYLSYNQRQLSHSLKTLSDSSKDEMPTIPRGL